MEINIKGMSCAGCSAAVDREVNKLNGVKLCAVNLIAAKANIEFDSKKISQEKIIEVIEKLGFETSFDIKFDDKSKLYSDYKKKLIISAVLTLILLCISMLPMIPFVEINLPNFIDMKQNPINYAIIQLVLTIGIMFLGRNFFISGFKKIKNPNMDTLVAIGTSSAFIYSLYSTYKIIMGDVHFVHSLYFESSGTIITLILLGKTLETKALSKTSNAIKKLMELTPDKAFLVDNGEIIEVDLNEIKVGDTLLIKPGSKIPVDGVVLSGLSYIDESMLTGESMPVKKESSDNVSAGTINKNGTLEIEVKIVGQNTLLAKIIKFVEDAQATKAPIAKLADIISGRFVPIVIIIATISALVWSFEGIEFALTIFVSVLVIACPCALGLATPTAIMVASGRSANEGILFKNSETLEIAHKANAIVFDKTGTITNGKPVVTDVIVNNIAKDELLSIVYSGEKLSEHPIAFAICDYAKDMKSQKISDFEVLVGSGIRYKSYQQVVEINKNIIVPNEFKCRFNELSSEGKTVIIIAIDGEFKGMIAVSDTLREESKKLIENLKLMNIETYMLTGDNNITANAIGKSVGISNVISNVLPNEKALYIEKLQKEGKIVIMVGDGINDAPALTLANIGIAVSSGTDIAMESSDIVLLNDNISQIITALKLSKKTMTNIKQNLFWAFIYNLIFIPVASGVLYVFGGPILNPMFAALAMSLSSFSVVTNALRLNKVKL